jgi:hypothetical protein
MGRACGGEARRPAQSEDLCVASESPLFTSGSLDCQGLMTAPVLYGLGGVAGAGAFPVPKSTTGGASVPAAASKYVRGFAPVTLAVSV